MTRKPRSELELDEHLRRTLRAVAATVEAGSIAAPKRRRTGRRVMVGLGAAAVAVPLAAWAVVGVGPEYVDEIPPDNPIVTGSVDGSRYWMVEAFHKDDCGKPFPGVELVVEDRNIIGREWDTHLITYGNLAMEGCRYDPPSNRGAEPSRWDSSAALVDGTFVWVAAVHPDVTGVRVTIDGSSEEVEVHPVDEAGYAVYEVPEDIMTYTVEVLVDGEVVPGSAETRTTPDFIPE